MIIKSVAKDLRNDKLIYELITKCKLLNKNKFLFFLN